MDEYDFLDKQAKMLNEIVEVFERNDANIFEMCRVLTIAYKVAKAQFDQMLDDLGEQVASMNGYLDDLLGESE